MEFRILGDLTILGARGPLQLGPPKQRTLAAMLMVDANSLVALERITEELWEHAPPRSAVANIRTYASRIRTAMPPAERDRLIARPAGYRLRLVQDELDLSVFEAHAAAGRKALERGDAVTAVSELSVALGQWRGPFAADVPAGGWLSAREVALNERREVAEEDRCEAMLALGQHASAIGALRRLTSAHPLRERGWALLMRALYAVHDTAGALAAFAQVKHILEDGLGIGPGAELQHVHRAILRSDHMLAPGSTQARVDLRTRSDVPRQLPASPRLVGRADELARLAAVLTRGGDDPVLVCVCGPSGSGKTSVAVSAAQLAADHFPDGQLFANLGGTGGRGRRCGPELSRQFLDELGEAVPPGTDADRLVARFRSLLAGRRVLVVLDDVKDAASVRPLLPMRARSAVVVTSRRILADLDGAVHLVVRALSVSKAVDMLASIIGERRVWAEPGAAARIAVACGGLPAKMRSAGARLLEQPDRSLQDLADQLADRQTRGDVIEADVQSECWRVPEACAFCQVRAELPGLTGA